MKLSPKGRNSSSTAVLILLGLVSLVTISNAFVAVPVSPSSLPVAKGVASSTTSLSMVFGPKSALAIERTKNPQKTESTIQGLMKSKGLTRAQAEQRYGEFLVDPDGFALRASELERREKGYKDWKEQAIARSDDPEATRKRIDEFQKRNSIKGTAIIFLFFTAVSIYNGMNPYVPPGH